MDGQITQEKYQGMKTAGMNGTLKIRRLKSLLMKKLHSPIILHIPLRMEKEDNININTARRAII
jgi:hypothetical protein